MLAFSIPLLYLLLVHNALAAILNPGHVAASSLQSREPLQDLVHGPY